MFTYDGTLLRVETKTQRITLENGRVTSLVSKATGKTYLSCSGDGVGLSAQWQGGDHKRLDTGTVETRLLSENRAQVLFHSWYGDGTLMLWADEETGDLCARPSVSSGRMGVKSVCWDFAGVDPSLYALVPCCQGVRLKLDDPELAGAKYAWPSSWEIGLCIFESDAGDGFWVHCRDTRYVYKDLSFGKDEEAGSFSLHCEAYGPLDSNRSAGGLVWRVNCFEGGWRVPAGVYRDWYYRAYDLLREEQSRLPWLSDVQMAVSWANADTACLDALAKQVDPKKVLIHMATWRDQPYDQNYPTYIPSQRAAEYIAHGAKLGFHICPHMNAMEIDPSHEVYAGMADFKMLDIDKKTPIGWGFDGEKWAFLGVPWTELAKTAPVNRRFNIMTKLHTGLSAWHTELRDRMAFVAENYPVGGCFIDVTLCTYNLHNALVEGRTSTEGLNDMIHLLSEIRGGLPIGGEGLNEITAQGLSFAQMHLYHSTHFSSPSLSRFGGDCAIGDFMYGRMCRTIGYHALAGRDDNERLRHQVYCDHNTIPTLITNDPREILEPNETVRTIFDRAR